MTCSKVQKVKFGTYMLSEEAGDWWDNEHQRMEVVGDEITWVVFKIEFLEKYFMINLCSKKEMEFLELKHGSMTIIEYASKFEGLVKLCPHYNSSEVGGSKRIRFECGLHPKIKQGIGYQEILHFLMLVNK